MLLTFFHPTEHMYVHYRERERERDGERAAYSQTISNIQAPEVMMDQKYTGKADVYSFALVMYEMVSMEHLCLSLSLTLTFSLPLSVNLSFYLLHLFIDLPSSFNSLTFSFSTNYILSKVALSLSSCLSPHIPSVHNS